MAAPQPEPLPVSPAADLSGTTVGRFLIADRLGAGGMGEVYRAEDTLLKRAVALKRVAPRLRADQRYRERLIKEAERASAVTHPHIAAIFDVLEDKGDLFLVMEYAEGVTLRERWREPLRLEQFLAIAIQLAEALGAAHDKGLVHGDVKPENIMVSADGNVKILDFGVAKRLPSTPDSDLTETSDTTREPRGGTPGYIAPEVLMNRGIDGRADIFSLGVVFYEALSGGHPFRESGFVPTVDRVLHQVPTPISQLNLHVPAELARIVDKMLAKDPADRYATARDLLVDLRAVHRSAYLSDLLVGQQPRRWPGRRWALLAGVAALVILMVATVWLLRQPVRQWLNARTTPAEKRLAVMPIDVMPVEAASRDQQVGALASGLTEVLTTQLTRLSVGRQLNVIPATESRRLTGVEQASTLGANLVLTGSLQLWGDKARLAVNLLSLGDRRQLDGRIVDGSMRAPMEFEDSVVAAALEMLRVKLPAPERRALTAQGTQVAASHEAWIEGRGFLLNYDRAENVNRAVASFRRALQLDPNYALAHASLGEAYWRKYDIQKDKQWMTFAQQSCEQALNLDPKLAAGHTCLGILYRQMGEYGKAVTEFDKALESEPASDDAYRGLAAAYEGLGRFDDAERTYQRAINLREKYWAGYNWLGAFYMGRARYADAARMFAQVLEQAPENLRGCVNLAGAYTEMTRYADAITVLERCNKIQPSDMTYGALGAAYFRLRQFPKASEYYGKAVGMKERDYRLWANLGDSYYWTAGKREQATAAYQKTIALGKDTLAVNPRDGTALAVMAKCHARLDEKDAARRELQQALALATPGASLLYTAALVHLQLGETDQALSTLEKSLAAGLRPARLRDDPSFDGLRDNSRFQRLLQGQQSRKSDGH